MSSARRRLWSPDRVGGREEEPRKEVNRATRVHQGSEFSCCAVRCESPCSVYSTHESDFGWKRQQLPYFHCWPLHPQHHWWRRKPHFRFQFIPRYIMSNCQQILSRFPNPNLNELNWFQHLSRNFLWDAAEKLWYTLGRTGSHRMSKYAALPVSYLQSWILIAGSSFATFCTLNRISGQRYGMFRIFANRIRHIFYPNHDSGGYCNTSPSNELGHCNERPYRSYRLYDFGPWC